MDLSPPRLPASQAESTEGDSPSLAVPDTNPGAGGLSYALDPQTGALLDVSGDTAGIFHASAAELLAEPCRWLQLLHRDDRADVLRALQTQRPGQVATLTYRVSQGGSGVRWVEAHHVGRDDGRGALAGIDGVAHDITRRVLGDSLAYEHSEAKYRRLMEQASDGVVVLELDGSIAEANSAIGHMLGRPLDAIIGASILDLIVDPGRLGHTLGWQRAHSGKRMLETHQMRRADGGLLPVEISSSLLPNGRVQGIVRDVTERLRADAELRIRDRAIESSLSGIVLLDLDRRVTYVNRSFMLMTGHSSGHALIGQAADDLLHNASPLKEIARAFKARGGWSGEVVLRRADDSTVEVEVQASVALDHAGEPLAIMASVVDVSDRNREERERRQLSAMLVRASNEWRLTVDSLDFPIVLVELDGTVLRTNRAAAALADLEIHDIIGLGLHSLAQAQPWIAASQMVNEQAGGRSPASCEVAQIDGGRSWEVVVCPSNVSGDSARLVVVIRDITERAELQASLRRSEVMSAMGALVGGVAHEVRNPLFAISAVLEAFEMRVRDREEFVPFITVLHEQVGRLVTLMQDLLDYGRPQTVNLQVTSMERVVNEALRISEDEAARRSIEVEVRVEPDAPPVRLDSVRFVQVIDNLVRNGLQHAPAGSRVQVRFGAELDGGRTGASLMVLDDGPGFPATEISQVFEPLFHRRKGGIGLGLSICERIVRAHDGVISAHNREGGGACVRVWLPTPVSEV